MVRWSVGTPGRRGALRAGLVVVTIMLGLAARAGAAGCGDLDDDGVDVIDAANVGRAAVGLPSACDDAPSACNVDAAGGIDVLDAASVARAAVGLPAVLACLPALRLATVLAGLDRPLFLTAARDDPRRLYVVEQPGRIRLVVDGALRPAPFLDLGALVSQGGEQGLLGLALHPEYEATGRLFVYYTDLAGTSVLAEHARDPSDPDRALPDPVRIFLTIPQPFANHNGGMLAFGADGFLYVGSGDGGSAGDPLDNAQNPASKLGKILRIDVDGHPTPPPGNLAGGDPDVWDLGLRNPFRFSFDRATGALYIGDVGQDRIEEIDVEAAGDGRRNYGWRRLEGSLCFDPPDGCDRAGTTPPVVEYGHDQGCSVIGGYVYRGAAIPGLTGRYLYADFCSRRVWSFVLADGAATSEVELTPDLDPGGLLGNVTSFGEDTAGELYLMDLDGQVLRIEPE